MTPHLGIPSRARHSVRSRFYTPPPQFDGCFTTFYQFLLEVEPTDSQCVGVDAGMKAGVKAGVEDYLQPEWGNIRFFAGSTPKAEIAGHSISAARFLATGPSALPCRFEIGPTRMWGVGFMPLGWARFFDTPAYDFVNLACDGSQHRAFAKFDRLTEVLTDPEASDEEQLDYLTATLDAMMRPSRDEAKILRIHEALVSAECATVAELANQCAMSVRTMERVCRRYFGFTPKRLMRRQRFMRSLTSFMLLQAKNGANGASGRWTEAMDAEYHDQAQFTREFREFMTMLPSDYAALDHPILSSFMEARARIWGSAAQTLDAPKDHSAQRPFG